MLPAGYRGLDIHDSFASAAEQAQRLAFQFSCDVFLDRTFPQWVVGVPYAVYEALVTHEQDEPNYALPAEDPPDVFYGGERPTVTGPGMVEYGD